MEGEFKGNISSDSDISLELEFEVEEYDDEDSIMGSASRIVPYTLEPYQEDLPSRLAHLTVVRVNVVMSKRTRLPNQWTVDSADSIKNKDR